MVTMKIYTGIDQLPTADAIQTLPSFNPPN